MFLTSLLLSVAPLPHTPLSQTPREVVTNRYHELAAAQDMVGLGKLWSDNLGLVLQTIDADLEGSLSLWEESQDAPPTERIRNLQQRALFGARAASLALDEPIFMDYASSFVGWSDDQKHAFRAGQQVFGRAAKELEEGNHEMAFEVAKETVERASALGDWWGTAMGYGAQAEAARHLGWFEDALLAYGMARQINHALGLRFSEFRNLQGMLAVARAAERYQRALALATDLVALARHFEDAPVLKSSLTAQLALENQLGLSAAAIKTQGALDALGE